ncbi:unnamed protein product [Adineta ricciae]|uniref:Uncharacterized protein n=1 Tax=Adineta ricciae TaxID=249248 RepID=A0A814P2U2_ADIRI|nr:unnamed protein product [Adineta ricciae]CAF1102008.1 unnamed protein product [Adineta ricciae]
MLNTNESNPTTFLPSYRRSIPSMLSRSESTRDRRNALPDTSSISHNANTFHQTQYCQQLANRVRELEDELIPDYSHSRLPSVYSSYSALTPCSSIGTSGISTYGRPHNFPINLVSPNTLVPTERYGLSPKIFERAHAIPERFWIDWQQKQMQQRIDELESIKNKSVNLNESDASIIDRRKSLILLHNTQRDINLPQSRSFNTTMSSSVDTETSSSSAADDQSLFQFHRRSLDRVNTNAPLSKELSTSNSSRRKLQSTLDRSHLTIPLPFSHNIYSPSVVERPSDETNYLHPTVSTCSSIEDVAKIDTELNVTLLSRKTSDQTSPLLYSKATINRTVEFQSSSTKNG